MSVNRLFSRIIVHSLLTLPLSVPLPSVAPADDAPKARSSLLEDEWHLIALGGEPVGYVHRTVRARREGGYRVVDSQKLRLRRKRDSVELQVTTTIEEDTAGRIIGFRILQSQSGAPLETIATRNEAGDALILTERTPGTPPRSHRIPLPADTLGPVRAIETMRSRLTRAGDTVELRILRPEARRCALQKAVLGPLERVRLLDGAERVLRRVDLSGPGIESRRWVDAEFALFRSSTPLFGRSLQTHRSTRARVLERDVTSPPEVFVASSIPTRERVPEGASEARYRLSSRRGPFGEHGGHLAEAPGQTVDRRTERAVELTVRRVRRDRASTRVDGEPAEYLRPNSYLQTDDPKLAERARRIAGDASDPWKAAHALALWVNRHIEAKDLLSVFASAREVLDTRRGDCSEHAVLLAALCRAVGIPSRVTAGLVFREDAFVGHMWVEVHVGEWVPLDPTQEDPAVHADHIALSTSSLEGAGASELFGGIVHLLGNLEIEVLGFD